MCHHLLEISPTPLTTDFGSFTFAPSDRRSVTLRGAQLMVVRQRAIQAEEKAERHHAILDAATRRLLREPDRVANVAEVADEAGLAKGTVYLYFPSKEELLLALHERNIDGFFRPLIERLESPQPVTIDDIFALTHEHLIAPPLFLRLAS